MAGYQDILQYDKGQSLDTESPRCHEEYLLSDPDKVSKVTICWPISTVGTPLHRFGQRELQKRVLGNDQRDMRYFARCEQFQGCVVMNQQRHKLG